MSKLLYTKNEVEFFKSQIYFTEDEEKVLEMWLLDKSIVEMSMKLNTSTATISRRKKSIKNKIDKLNDQIYQKKIILISN